MSYNDLFTADPIKGTLTWKVRPLHHFKTEASHKRHNTLFAGTIAGSLNKQGYVVVFLGRKTIGVHCILWEMLNGPIPKGMDIDHIDGVRSNNLPGNLRIATRGQNSSNSKMSRANKSGYKGVSYHPVTGKWAATIGVSKKKIHLGVFGTKWGAFEAYCNAARALRGEFARIY